MNILEAIEENRTQRVALIDEAGSVLNSFAIGKLTRLDSFPSNLVFGKFKILKDNLLIVGDGPNGKEIFNSKSEAVAAGALAKTYKEVEG